MSLNEHFKVDTSVERPFIVPKELLDTLNSICWFFADAFWMLEIPSLGYAMLIPTLITGLFLVYVEKRKPVINLRRMALAAILIGVMATGWIVFQNINQKPSSVAEISPGSTEKKRC